MDMWRHSNIISVGTGRIMQTSIRMDYGRNDVSYLDDVYIGGNRLSGYLDGRNNFVEYTGR